MKVSELIEKLNQVDPDAFVVTSIPETNGAHTQNIEKIELHDTDFGLVLVIGKEEA
jgi:hypothetical protein